MVKGKETQSTNQNIAVYVRCRPLNVQEKRQASYSVVEANMDRREVLVKERSMDKLQKTFTFDRVFDQNSSQVDLYKVVVTPLLEEVLQGYSCTVFAYGQTGTGKTYTMEGERSDDRYNSWEEDPESGIVPRAMHHLFESLREQALDYSLRVSFLELYNEELFDLLGPMDDASKLRLYEDPIRKGSVIVSGIEEVAVHSKDEVYSILEKGAQKRQTAATLMNANSSRSHTVFSITVHIKDNNMEGEELMKTGKLNLVDLAGSENIGRSGAVDKRAREAGNINQSLLTLGRVITALVERSPHIPYRESKLTRLLQDSLGGKTKTSIIATISPASINIEETLSTLDYAHRAKNITNKPEANQKLTKKTLIKQYTEEIERLRRDLTAAREKHGIYLDPEVYAQMTSGIEQKDDEIDDLLSQLKAMKDEMDKVNELFASTKIELDTKTVQLSLTQQSLNETQGYLNSTMQVLNRTAQDRDERNCLLNAQIKTEKLLTNQASQLVTVADVATTDVQKLHDKLQRKHITESYNEQHVGAFSNRLKQNLQQMERQINRFSENQLGFCHDIAVDYDKKLEKRIAELDAVRHLITSHVQAKLMEQKAFDNMIMDHSKGLSKWTEDAIDSARTFKEERVLAHMTHERDQLVHLLRSSIEVMNNQSALLATTREDIRTKVEQQQRAGLLHAETQLANLGKFSEDIDGLVKFHSGGVQSLQTTFNTVNGFQEEYQKNVQHQMEAMNAAMANMQKLWQCYNKDWKSGMNDADRQLRELDDNGSAIHSTVQSATEKMKQSHVNFENELNVWASDSLAFANEAIDKHSSLNQEAQEKMERLLQTSISFSQESQQALESNFQRVEKASRDHIGMLTTNLEAQHSHTQAMSNTMKSSVVAQEALLQCQQEEFSTCVLAQKDFVNRNGADITDWTTQTNDSIQELALEFQDFTTTFKKDVPSGNTPCRRQFSYPQQLAATSPHERILERYRTRMDQRVAAALPLPEDDDSFDEISSTSSAGIDSQNVSFVSSISVASSSSSEASYKQGDDDLKENRLNNAPIFKRPSKDHKACSSTIPKASKKPLRPKNVESS